MNVSSLEYLLLVAVVERSGSKNCYYDYLTYCCHGLSQVPFFNEANMLLMSQVRYVV